MTSASTTQTRPRTNKQTRLLVLALAALAGGIASPPAEATAGNGLCFSNGAFTLCLNPPTSPGGIVPPPAQGSQYSQTIGITTANGSIETLTQSFTPNAAAANVTRICVLNLKNGERMLTHNFTPPINSLRMGAGGTSCANFPANSRVNFQLFAAGRPATPDKTLTYSTTALAGGRLDLVWQ